MTARDRQSPYHYPVYTILLIVVTALLLSQWAGSAFDLPELAILNRIIDIPAHESWVFVGVALLVVTLMAAVVYWSSLNRFLARRPVFWLVLNGLAPGAIWAMAIQTVDVLLFDGPGLVTMIGCPLAVLVWVCGPFVLEGLVRRVCRRIERMVDEKGWRTVALRVRLMHLLWQPGDPRFIAHAACWPAVSTSSTGR